MCQFNTYLCSLINDILIEISKYNSKNIKTMKSLKTFILLSILFVCEMNVSAANKSNLIYNSEEVNGVKVAETVYKMDGNTLANYMKYNYKYDDQKRMTESEALKWNEGKGAWVKDMCIRYVYQGKSVTTSYYKWNNKKSDYILIPEMTVTMDNPNL